MRLCLLIGLDNDLVTNAWQINELKIGDIVPVLNKSYKVEDIKDGIVPIIYLVYSVEHFKEEDAYIDVIRNDLKDIKFKEISIVELAKWFQKKRPKLASKINIKQLSIIAEEMDIKVINGRGNISA